MSLNIAPKKHIYNTVSKMLLSKKRGIALNLLYHRLLIFCIFNSHEDMRDLFAPKWPLIRPQSVQTVLALSVLDYHSKAEIRPVYRLRLVSEVSPRLCESKLLPPPRLMCISPKWEPLCFYSSISKSPCCFLNL